MIVVASDGSLLSIEFYSQSVFNHKLLTFIVVMLPVSKQKVTS